MNQMEGVKIAKATVNIGVGGKWRKACKG